MKTESPAGPRSFRGASALAENQDDNLRASSVRIALGFFSLVALPVFVPGVAQFRVVLLGYVLAAIGFQIAIHRRIGGNIRVLLGGSLDVAMITFLVHRVGSQTTPLVAVYVLSSMFNALVAPAWSARLLGVVGIVCYAGVSYAEALRVLPYAPDMPAFAAIVPSVADTTRANALVIALVVVSTWVADRIARALRSREQELRAANALLEELSQRDPLTQLFNRRHFVRRVEEELGRVRRGHSLALLMMDLDGFKHVNDQQGHLAGDELLRKIARTIEETTREIDVVGRFGGDEFVALLPDTDAGQAGVVAERLVRTIREVGTLADPRRPVTASVGVAIAQPEDDVAVLLNAADEGAYLAKQAGGDRAHAVTPSVSGVNELDSGPRQAVRAG
jgi:diguanylate cyclase